MSKLRVHQVAAEFGTTPDAILRLLRGRGFPVRDTKSSVDPFALEWLRFEFTVDSPAPAQAAAAAPTPTSAPPTRLKLPFDRGPLRRRRGPVDRSPGQPANARVRTAAMFGTLPNDRSSLDVDAIEAGLDGSPYSLPFEQREYLSTSFLPRAAALAIRAKREFERVKAPRLATLRRITRSTEVYESNKIEGLGPDLATTDALLNSYDLHQRVDISVAQGAIEKAIAAEPKVRDVVGLGAARILAEIFCGDQSRPLSEGDLRELHDLIMVGDSRRGRYKDYVNGIKGSSHVPAAPSDTPEAMHELMAWLAQTQLTAIWRAAVAHAWLTHVHPFHDGNGRIARLLANLVLIREGLPPLVVRADSDRGAYLDALGESDQGGNILPLVRVFRDVLDRAVQDITDPQLADEIFDAELKRRAMPKNARWKMLVDDFLAELAPHLLLHQLNLYPIGEVAEADLRRLGNGYRVNAWIAKVGTAASSRDLLLHVAPSTVTPGRSRGTPRETVPAIFVSVRNERQLDAQQYLPVGADSFTYEFVPLIDTQQVAVRRRASVQTLGIPEAADQAAAHLARAHRELIGRI